MCVLTVAPVFAQESCEQYELTISGPSDFLVDTSIDFTAMLFDKESDISLLLNEELQGADVSYRVLQADRVIYETDVSPLSFSFPEAGVYEVAVGVKTDTCEFSSSLLVRVYDHVFFYLGEFLQDFNEWLTQNLQQQNILFAKFIVDAEEDLYADKERRQNLENKMIDIKSSQVIFFNLNNFSTIFELLDEWNDIYNVDFFDKKVVVISPIDSVLLKKFLAPFLREHDFSLYLFDLDKARDLFFYLSVGQIDRANALLDTPVEFRGGKTFFSLGSMVDTLIYSGFSMETLWMMLVLAVIVLVLVFFRQIMGFSVYGIYYPLLMAWVFVVLWHGLTLWLFALAFVAHFLGLLIQKKVAVLVHAKIGLYIVLYVILSVMALGSMTSWFGVQWDIAVSQDIVVLLAFLLVPLAGKKVFTTLKWFWKKNHPMNIIWFLILAYVFSLFLTCIPLQHWLLVRPSIVFIILLWVILLGKFTGLQFMEYVRFWPLIRKQLASKKPKKISMNTSSQK